MVCIVSCFFSIIKCLYPAKGEQITEGSRPSDVATSTVHLWKYSEESGTYKSYPKIFWPHNALKRNKLLLCYVSFCLRLETFGTIIISIYLPTSSVMAILCKHGLASFALGFILCLFCMRIIDNNVFMGQMPLLLLNQQC